MRLRYNLLDTTLGAQLNAAATSVTFAVKLTAADGDIPTIASPDYLPLRIEDEIVHLTAYTSGATSGTITRGEEGTTDATHVNGTAVENNPTILDFGMTSYVEDTDYELVQSQRFVGTTDPTSDGFDVVDGDEWVNPVGAAWTAYTPTLGTWTLGNGTISGAYMKMGKTLFLRGVFTQGSSTTTTTGSPSISLPSGLTLVSGQRQAGMAILRDSGGGLIFPALALVSSGASSVVFYETNEDNSFVTNTVPFTWATGDSIEFNMVIEVA